MKSQHQHLERDSAAHCAAGTPWFGVQQHGSVLIISLLILLILTLLGLSSMGTTSLEEKMANNMRDQNLAFQAAEAALHDGEQYVTGNAPVGFNAACNSGLCLPSTTGTPVWGWSPSSSTWGKAIAYGTGGGIGVGPLTYLTAQPVYLIEQLPPVPAPGVNLSQAQYGNTPPLQFYRITALATGGNPSGGAGIAGGVSYTMLQSVYQP